MSIVADNTSREKPPDVGTAELQAHQLGYSTLPIDARTKRPALASWQHLQTAPAGDEERLNWPRTEAFGIVCGSASSMASADGGNELLALDFDVPGFLDAWLAEVGTLADGLTVQRTGGGGHQVLFFCPNAGSNEKLAWAPNPANPDGREVAIETRGNGGYVVVAPSIHPTGNRYEWLTGNLDSTPTVSQAHSDALKSAARKLCKAPLRKAEALRQEQAKLTGNLARSSLNGQASVIEAYNNAHPIRDVLRSHGYAQSGLRMLRPNADATSTPGITFLEKDGREVCFAHSSNDALSNGHTHDSFSIFATLEHGGDLRKAVRAAALELGLANITNSPPPAQHYTPSFDLETGEVIPPPAIVAPNFRSARDIIGNHPTLRPPIIEGLLRAGETMNLIAPPKAGKSWLTLDLALSIATGRAWLGRFPTVQGDVLICDNELHLETSASRLPKVANARGIQPAEYIDRLYVDNLRGRLRDLISMGSYFDALEPGRWKLIVLDAWYRFLPAEASENDNAVITSLYNFVDRQSARLGCAFVCIHHSSKGGQSDRAVTDVGAGAGAQARAADTHAVLRQHAEDGCVVFDAAVRSWAPLEPFALRWAFPIFTPDDSLDPTDLKTPGRRKRKDDAEPVEPKAARKVWTVAEYVASFLTSKPITPDELSISATLNDLSKTQAKSLLRAAVAQGIAHKWGGTGGRPARYATAPEPLIEGGPHE